MFELSHSAFGKYRRYDLHNPATGMGFSIVPELGATVLEIQFDGNPILDGYQTPEELEKGKWGKSAVLFPFPNRLKDGKYFWDGKEYQFPINNADTGNAIHGFTRHERFEVTHIELSKEGADISCRLDYDGRYEGYPFPLSLELSFGITNRHEFNVQIFVKNRHSATIPVGFGWHPYFKLQGRTDEHVLQLPDSNKVGIDARMIPDGSSSPYTVFHTPQRVGATQLDNCFKINTTHPLYHLMLKAGEQQVSLVASSNLFPFYQVFTPPSRESIALEPMSCNVDAFNNGEGLVSLPPAGDWAAAFRLEYHSLKRI